MKREKHFGHRYASASSSQHMRGISACRRLSPASRGTDASRRSPTTGREFAAGGERRKGASVALLFWWRVRFFSFPGLGRGGFVGFSGIVVAQFLHASGEEEV